MARYVLVKEQENETIVVYQFGPDETRLGQLRLNKQSGIVDELEPVPADSTHIFFPPAAVKIRQHWKIGAFPERTSWAS